MNIKVFFVFLISLFVVVSGTFFFISGIVYSNIAPIVEENKIEVSYIGESTDIGLKGNSQFIFHNFNNEKENYFNIEKLSYSGDCEFEKDKQYTVLHTKKDVSSMFLWKIFYINDTINYYKINEC